MITYPFGYSTSRRTLEQIRVWLLEHHHPEYVRRFCAWLESKQGVLGPGGGWRDDGSQPDKPGFAPEGKSFHQNQRFVDGFIGACAVDIVKSRPGGIHIGVSWDDVPAQGSAEAVRWGLHANVGRPGDVGSEPWHIQPIEIDGWQSWMDASCPAPRSNYPLPEEDDMAMTAEERQALIADIAAAVETKIMQRTATIPNFDGTSEQKSFGWLIPQTYIQARGTQRTAAAVLQELSAHVDAGELTAAEIVAAIGAELTD